MKLEAGLNDQYDILPIMAEGDNSDRDLEKFLASSGGLDLAEVFLTIVRKNCDLESADKRYSGKLPFVLFRNKGDNYSGSLILRILHSGGASLELYDATLEQLTDKTRHLPLNPVMEIKAGTKGSNRTGREGLEISFTRPLLVPSKSSDWVLKVARQCSTLSAEHIGPVYTNEE